MTAKDQAKADADAQAKADAEAQAKAAADEAAAAAQPAPAALLEGVVLRPYREHIPAAVPDRIEPNERGTLVAHIGGGGTAPDAK